MSRRMFFVLNMFLHAVVTSLVIVTDPDGTLAHLT